MNKDLIVSTAPKSVFAESVRTLRTNLQFTFMKNKKNVVMITSSIQGEGKSFTCANLALAFAATNTKTIIIDCDLRKGRISNAFKIKEDTVGLSDLLIADNDDYKSYIIKTNHENLSIIPKGTVPPNPSELLGSINFNDLIISLKKSYDLIILDCPPISYVTDALVMTKVADEAVLVCSCKKTPMSVLIESKKSLESTGIKIAGVVMNNLPKEKKSYYTNKYYK